MVVSGFHSALGFAVHSFPKASLVALQYMKPLHGILGVTTDSHRYSYLSCSLQYFARGCQTYHAQLQAAVKGKGVVEQKDEQVRWCSGENSVSKVQYLVCHWTLICLGARLLGIYELQTRVIITFYLCNHADYPDHIFCTYPQ